MRLFYDFNQRHKGAYTLQKVQGEYVVWINPQKGKFYKVFNAKTDSQAVEIAESLIKNIKN